MIYKKYTVLTAVESLIQNINSALIAEQNASSYKFKLKGVNLKVHSFFISFSISYKKIKKILKNLLKNVDFFEKPRIIICEYLRLVEFKLNKEKKLKLNSI